jgi:hypothetical protein
MDFTSFLNSHIYDDVMAPGLVGDCKDGRPGVLIPPGVLHLAGEFSLKILPYSIHVHLHGMRHVYLLRRANSDAELRTERDTRPLR